MAILTLIEATTRYVYARALTSGTAAAAAVALRSILDKNGRDGAPIIRSLVIDGGPEFKGATKTLLEHYHIKVNVAAARTHQRLARVDRYHRTLREQIGRLMASRRDTRWADALPDLVSGYNNAVHRTLGMSPVAMNAAPRAAYKICKVDRKQARMVRKAVTKRAENDGLRPGMWVRVVLNRYSAFSKASDATWSATVKLVQRIHNNAWEIDPETLEKSREAPALVYPTYMIQRTEPPPRVPVKRAKTAVRASTAAQRARTAVSRDKTAIRNVIRRELPEAERAPVMASRLRSGR
jgi:hypothetical protein